MSSSVPSSSSSSSSSISYSANQYDSLRAFIEKVHIELDRTKSRIESLASEFLISQRNQDQPPVLQNMRARRLPSSEEQEVDGPSNKRFKKEKIEEKNENHKDNHSILQAINRGDEINEYFTENDAGPFLNLHGASILRMKIKEGSDTSIKISTIEQYRHVVNIRKLEVAIEQSSEPTLKALFTLIARNSELEKLSITTDHPDIFLEMTDRLACLSRLKKLSIAYSGKLIEDNVDSEEENYNDQEFDLIKINYCKMLKKLPALHDLALIGAVITTDNLSSIRKGISEGNTITKLSFKNCCFERIWIDHLLKQVNVNKVKTLTHIDCSGTFISQMTLYEIKEATNKFAAQIHTLPDLTEINLTNCIYGFYQIEDLSPIFKEALEEALEKHPKRPRLIC